MKNKKNIDYWFFLPKLSLDAHTIQSLSFRLRTPWHKCANVIQSQIWESKEQKLGIIIDKNMEFDELIPTLSKKGRRKLCALRICILLNLQRYRSLMKAFVESQFGYSPLGSNNRINHLHEWALTIVLNYHSSYFENRLVIDNCFNSSKEHSFISNRTM